MKRTLPRLLLPLLTAASVMMPMPPSAHASAPAVVVSQTVAPLAQGVTLTSFERLYAHGWVHGQVIRADLTVPGISANLISAPAVTAAKPLTSLMERAGAIAAVNGDFFDINNTKMPLGPAVQDGQLLKSAPPGWQAAGLDTDGIGRLLNLVLTGSLTLPSGETLPLATVNQYTVPDDAIGLYTPLWTVGRSKSAAFGSSHVREVTVRDGIVTQISDKATDEPTPPGTLHLVGREKGADLLSGLQVGDPVAISYAAHTDTGSDLVFAVGGEMVLVRDGQVQHVNNTRLAPQTAIGFSADGRELILLAVDGRSRQSAGLTLAQLADLMLELGAYNAMQLDGGGSTTAAVKNPATQLLQVVNQPSDGAQRSVPNGVAIFAPAGSGRAVSTLAGPRTTAAGADRVFPGLHRTLTATAQDEQFTPVRSIRPIWTNLTPDFGTLSNTGLFQAHQTGVAKVRASAVGRGAEVQLQVLGALDRIETDPPALQLGASQTGLFTLRGYDREGYSAPIEPRDVTLHYDQDRLTVVPTVDGRFRVNMPGPGQAVIELEVQGRTVSLPVSSGLVTSLVADFEELQPFQFNRHPATVEGALDLVPGLTGNGLQLTYNLAGQGTRAAYLDAPGGLVLPGAPRTLGAWVKGDAQGAWLRATLVDAANRTYTLDLHEKVDWLDWARVETPIPVGVTYPVRLTRIYPVETDSTRVYAGELIFDDLFVTEDVPLPTIPEASVAPDRAIVSLNGLAEVGQRIAFVIPAKAERALSQAAEHGAHVITLGGGKSTSMELDSTRLIFLNASNRSLREADFAQVARLQADLTAAAQDPTVKHVVVIADHPLGVLSDWREAALIEQWLTDFRRQAPDKSATYVAPGWDTTLIRVDGASYLYGQAMLLNLGADGHIQVADLP